MVKPLYEYSITVPDCFNSKHKIVKAYQQNLRDVWKILDKDDFSEVDEFLLHQKISELNKVILEEVKSL